MNIINMIYLINKLKKYIFKIYKWILIKNLNKGKQQSKKKYNPFNMERFNQISKEIDEKLKKNK